MTRKIGDALDLLKRDPTRPVRAQVGDMEVEIRAVAFPHRSKPLGDLLASIGPWEGETTEQLVDRLREARRSGGSEPPPEL